MLVCGNVREGKTLLMVHECGLYRANGGVLPIYINFNRLDLSNTIKVGVSELLDLEGLEGGILACDEAYTWLESRVSSSNLNRYVSYFLFQSGKRGVDVIATSQLGSAIDLRFFDLAHVIVLARNNRLAKRFEYQYFVRCGVRGRVVTRFLSYADAEKFWHIYDTFAPVAPLGLKQLQFEMEKYNTEKINKRVDGIVVKALGFKVLFGWFSERDVFRYQVEDWLLREGEPLPLAPLVTNRLKCLLRSKK